MLGASVLRSTQRNLVGIKRPPSPRSWPRQTPRQECFSRCPTATHQSLPDRILSGQSLVVVFPNYLRHDLLYAIPTAMPAPVYLADGHCLVLLKRRATGRQTNIHEMATDETKFKYSSTSVGRYLGMISVKTTRWGGIGPARVTLGCWQAVGPAREVFTKDVFPEVGEYLKQTDGRFLFL